MKSNSGYTKCSFYKPYISFLEKKPNPDKSRKVKFFIETPSGRISFFVNTIKINQVKIYLNKEF